MSINNLVAATYAPMLQDQSLNLDMVEPYMKFLKSNNVQGAFINGSTGDFASLTVNERKLITEAWASIKSDEFVLINHVGHTSLKVAKELTIHAADKVDAISCLSPYYFVPPTLESIIDYCKQVAACAPELPFYYYHIPQLTGGNFSMINFLKLGAAKIPNFAGIKFTKNDLVDFSFSKNYANGDYNILFGVDEIFLTSLSLGAQGWVGSTYNHLAPLYYKIKDAYENNDVRLAAKLQYKSMQFVDILNSHGGFNGVAKSFMKLLGIDCGPSRYPHKSVSNGELKIIRNKLMEKGIMEHTSSFIKV